jgi:hypothetical protein
MLVQPQLTPYLFYARIAAFAPSLLQHQDHHYIGKIVNSIISSSHYCAHSIGRGGVYSPSEFEESSSLSLHPPILAHHPSRLALTLPY